MRKDIAVDTELAELKQKIEQKRAELNQLGKDRGGVIDARMIELSQALDELIIDYMHMVSKNTPKK